MKVIALIAVFVALAASAAAIEEVVPQNKTESDDRTCNPADCRLEGECTWFQKCNKETSRWEDFACPEGLYWNSEWNADESGGSCDFWEHLSPTLQASLEQMKHCFPECYFREDGACSSTYIYHPTGTDHRIEQTLKCPDGLIWNQSLETCDYCKNVQNGTVACDC